MDVKINELSIIPAKSFEYSGYNISDRFFGKTKRDNITICYYDFNYNKWMAFGSNEEIKEYYEISEDVFTSKTIPLKTKKVSGIFISNYFFCLAKSITGETVKTICFYRFDKNKWCFKQSGIKELIGYYKYE